MSKNEEVLKLLETLQEYERSMADIQSYMVDGYLDIAQTKKSSFGLIWSSVPVSEEARMVFRTNKEIDDQKELPLVPGVSEKDIEQIRSSFEKAIKQAIISAKILGQINEQIAKIEELQKTKSN
ncbi:hypothetical protein TVAG_450590 [Trichomonas vaginalis G3]|uniref:Uncharacterized protein n=1 Tax=Trichomonas vaginalis (strain ATCC PRA-98 / G3) TaxID=412133 RepID=A2EV36_TRIV3|nr:hypothetical protein TVAGG3_0946260 [Trichomonas vaginalis G3]EAY03486.1 hypothetical protein TVAG_450590 [Trichomonas vaginalis G3]KAI5486895.1 hypothetical protein TVAGG3_0946260 [Trichomonas vaginalis G3]|eukprot:XP_001315709.1 hypothetical protein [Trichomonas vaginalis G3]